MDIIISDGLRPNYCKGETVTLFSFSMVPSTSGNMLIVVVQSSEPVEVSLVEPVAGN